MGAEQVAAILEDPASAPIEPRLRAMLGFLDKLTLRPEEVDHRDVEPLHAAGLDDHAITEAVYVCFLFNVMDRIADALDFDDGDEVFHRRTGYMLHRMGYGVVRKLNALGRRGGRRPERGPGITDR